MADLGSKSGTVVVRGGIRINAAQEGTPAVHGDRIMTATGLLLAEIVGEVSSDSSP